MGSLEEEDGEGEEEEEEERAGEAAGRRGVTKEKTEAEDGIV